MKSLINVSVRYGLLAGITGAILLVGLYYLGRHPFLIPVFMDFRIILFGFFIFFALREIRDHYQNGIMFFWQGLIGSFVFTLTYAALSSLILLGFMAVVPAFLADYISLTIQQLKALPQELIDRIGKETFDRNLEMLPATDKYDLAFLYFSQSFMISLFISIILSVILRRQPKP
jgi:hypothetical protein